MHEISKIRSVLIDELYDVFSGIFLENGYTLLEEDFTDTSYLRRYPHQYPFDENSVNYFSKNNLLDEIQNSALLLEEKNDLILAIDQGKRINNQYLTWQEVPFEYLNKYANGFYFIKPNVYIFYTAALIKNLVLDMEYLKGIAFDKWLSRFLMQNIDCKMLIEFNKDQSLIIEKFLYSLLVDDNILELIEVENVEKALKAIQ